MSEPRVETRRSKIRREAAGFAKVIGVALLFRAFIAQAYVIPSESMVPTLVIDDHVYVNRLAYKMSTPQRGDIIVFDHPREHGTELIKRVVGIGGDVVEGRDGQVWVNGVASGPSFDFAAIEVPKDNLWVMGDNRDNSADSRYWGTVPLGLVDGKAFVIWWNGSHPSRSMTTLR
jgi:signal peptidase I